MSSWAVPASQKKLADTGFTYICFPPNLKKKKKKSIFFFSPSPSMQWGTVDAEMRVPCGEVPELTDFLPFKPGVGQNVATHAFPTAMNCFLVQLNFPWSVHLHPPQPATPSNFFLCWFMD